MIMGDGARAGEIPTSCRKMHGPYIPGLAAIPTVNEGVYRLGGPAFPAVRRSGVIGDAGAASADKGEKAFSRDLGPTSPRR